MKSIHTLLICATIFFVGCGDGEEHFMRKGELKNWAEYDAATTTKEKYTKSFVLWTQYGSGSGSDWNPDGRPSTHPKTGETAKELMEKHKSSLNTQNFTKSLKEDNERMKKNLGE